MIEIVTYESYKKKQWDNFVEKSKNGIFSLKRDFVEYHAHRFTDYSLMVYFSGNLVAVLPANIAENIVYSHQGLTWGGFVVAENMTTKLMLQVFDKLKSFLKKNKIQALHYKAIPSIFPNFYSEEDLYALFQNGAVLERSEVSSVVNLKKELIWQKRAIFLRANEKLKVVVSDDIPLFMSTVKAILNKKYNTNPTHTVDEMLYLKSKFPKNIFLLLVYNGEEYLGGTIYYVFKNVIHTQYIGLTEQGKKERALSVAINYIIEKYKNTHQYLSFGISTEKGGTYLNENLIKSKEDLGGNAIVHHTYKLCW